MEEVARFAAALLHHTDTADLHCLVDGFGHVVDRQAGDRNGSQRLHLHPGLAGQLDGCLNAKPRIGSTTNEVSATQKMLVAIGPDL